MANGLSVIKLRHRLGVSPYLLPAVPFAALPPVSRRVAAYRAPRRAVLGLGFSFFPQFINMAAPNLGTKSFIASARQKGAVEKVKLSHYLHVMLCLLIGDDSNMLPFFWFNFLIKPTGFPKFIND